jgi:CRISPR system Cascade subunit CasA
MTLRYSLIDEPLIGTRLVDGGRRKHYTLPGLFAALAADRIRDFPALRPHQRHPWHAFLVQLAAMALHLTGQTEPFSDEETWKAALLALTPDDPDGAAWYLVTPPDRPALMQAPVPGGSLQGWKNRFHAPDELDMLITSKNHDLKAIRMRRCAADDWLMALISLQTQEGFLGVGNYGISRMNGGFASRPALGAVPQGHWGQRWLRDVRRLLDCRAEIASEMDLREQGGLGLVWLMPWSGNESLAFSTLDPFYIEICRRIRLTADATEIIAVATGSKAARIEAKDRNGITGDPWIPIDIGMAKALTITAKGFDYKLSSELLFGQKYRTAIAQTLTEQDGTQGIVMLAQGVTRGQGKTEGYHERRIPISPTVRRFMVQKKTDTLAKIAEERVNDIAKIRALLWTALATLIENGAPTDKFSDSAKDKANRFVKAFEQGEDARFFDGPLGLNEEIESTDPSDVRLRWYLAMAERAERILIDTFEAGPRSGEQRYRARAAALRRFHGGLRSDKTLPTLAQYYRDQRDSKETAHVQP